MWPCHPGHRSCACRLHIECTAWHSMAGGKKGTESWSWSCAVQHVARSIALLCKRERDRQPPVLRLLLLTADVHPHHSRRPAVCTAGTGARVVAQPAPPRGFGYNTESCTQINTNTHAPAMTLSAALWMLSAMSFMPRCRNIITPLNSRAVGLARFLPAMSGAVPWTASMRARPSKPACVHPHGKQQTTHTQAAVSGWGGGLWGVLLYTVMCVCTPCTHTANSKHHQEHTQAAVSGEGGRFMECAAVCSVCEAPSKQLCRC